MPTAAATFARELIGAPDDAARAASLDARRDAIGIDLARGLLEEGMRALKEGALDRGLVAFRTARTVAERASLRAVGASAAIRIAQTYSALGENDRALALLRESEEIYRDLNDTAAMLQVMNNQALVHRLRGDLDEALALHQQVLAAREKIKIAPGANVTPGATNGAAKTSPADAAAHAASLANALNNLATTQLELGDYRGALVNAHRSLEYRRPGSLEYANTLNNLGRIYHAQGDLAVARSYYARALDIPETVAPIRMDRLANLAAVIRQLGQPDEAVTYAEQGVALAEQSGARPMLARNLRVLGLIQADRGQRPQAVAHLERSLSVARSTSEVDAITAALVDFGSVLLADRAFARALTLAEEAIALGDAVGPLRQMQAYRVAGQAQAGLGHLAEARRLLRAAIDRTEDLRERVSGAEVERQQFLEGHLQPYHGLIQLLIDQGEHEQALRYAEQARARSLLDVTQRGHVSLARWLKPDERQQERALERRLGDLQRRQAELLSKRLSAKVPAGGGAAPGAGASETAPPPSAERDSSEPLAEPIAAARREIAVLRARLFAAHPELRLARGAAAIPTLSELGSGILDSSTAVLAYTVTAGRAWVFVITTPAGVSPSAVASSRSASASASSAASSSPTSPASAAASALSSSPASTPTPSPEGAASSAPQLRVHALPLDAPTLTTRVRRFRETLATRDLGFAAEARTLYDDLLGPAAADCRGKTRLIVVPDGVLWDLPFQALQTPERRYLIEDAAVAYAPSLTFLYERLTRARAPRDAAGLDLLAFGNPTLSASEAAAFAPLPDAEDQVRRLAALYPAGRATTLVGAAAREARVKRDAGRYRVLHFATHGVLDDGNPLYSALLLAADADKPAAAGTASPAAGGGTDDGRLEARELMEIPLAADLVVLSACETARGRIGAGEGVVGLSWALLLAGSANTVVSQWKVDAGSTSELMVGFHRALRRTPAVAVDGALRSAALEVMKNGRYRHPFYWAGFRVVGAAGR